jgi:ureidoglycolate lyase
MRRIARQVDDVEDTGSGGVKVYAELLTGDGFAGFGDVIGVEYSAPPEGHATQRFDDLLHIDVSHDGKVSVNTLHIADKAVFPIRLSELECHPLGSQAFIPLSSARFIVAVCPQGPAPDLSQLRVFVTGGRQGVNFAPGVWHAPFTSLDSNATVLMIERNGPGSNLRKVAVRDSGIVVEAPA